MAVTNVDNLRQTASVALLFWGTCLFLAGLEAAVGDNLVSKGLFFVSIPAMVIALLWANRSLLRSRERWTALATMAISVFVYASVILLFGLLAATQFKVLLLAS